MNEAINTNEVKRRIQCCIDTKECILCPFFKIGCDKSTFAKLMRKAVQQHEDHIRDLTKMIPKWISVEDRLPEFHEKVVVSDGKHAWDYGMYGGWYGRKDAWQWKHNTVRHVKWWMPKKDALPEPPKEGEHE